jgi:hypothetical protein
MTFASHDGWRRDKSVPSPSVAAIALLFAISALCLSLCMKRNINVYDEGLILTGAVRVLDGAVPHRDFYANYGPGQFYILAALYKVFGVSVLVKRAWDIVVQSCSVVLVFIIVSQVARRGIAVWSAVVSIISLGACQDHYGYPIFPTLAAILAGLVFLAPALGRARSTPRLVAAGACAGIAMLFRYDVGFATFVVECLILALNAWLHPEGGARPIRAVLHAVVLFGLGFAVIVAPVATALAVSGAIPDMIFDVVRFPAQSYVEMRSLPFPDVPVLLANPIHFAVYVPFAVCAAAVATIFAIVRRRKAGENAETEPVDRRFFLWMLMALVVLTVIFVGKSWVRPRMPHIAMALITSVALVGMLAQPVPGRGLVGRSLAALAFFAMFVWSCIAVPGELLLILENVVWATVNPTTWEISTTPVPGSCRMPAGLERLACFWVRPETIETIRYVQERTSPDDSVFVGLSRHDKIFVNDVLLYFAMNRKPATKWYHFDPGLQTSAPIQREMVGELERAQPKLIVIEARWADAMEPNGSALGDATVLDDYIRQTFVPVAMFGLNTVLRRRLPARPYIDDNTDRAD